MATGLGEMGVHFTEVRVEPYRGDRPGIPSCSRYVTCLAPLSSSSLDLSTWQVATLSHDLLQCFRFTTGIPFPITPLILYYTIIILYYTQIIVTASGWGGKALYIYPQ